MEGCGAGFSGRGGWIDLALLAPLVTLLGALVIPSHWTSIWMDREFTGTVAPIANRLQDGLRLYADGGHIPMPPLPFVLMRVLTAGEATWLWESALNFGFQMLAVGLGYLALARLFRPPVPFLATLVTIPVFFALPKTVLYDSMVQAAVAALALMTVAYLGRPAGDGRKRLPGIACLAAASAVALLVKQSTGAGACVGLAAALLLCDRGRLRDRVARAATFAVLTAIAVAALALLVAPWADPLGLIRDVFFGGAEPKGGPRLLLGHLRRYALDIGKHGLALLPVVAVVIAVASRMKRGRGRERGAAAAREIPRAFVACGAIASAVGLCAVVAAGPWSPAAVLSRTRFLAEVLWLGFFLALVLGLRRWRPRLLRSVAGPGSPRALAGTVAVVLAAAVFHSLSTYVFRWSYDNNPLVPVAYGALFQVALALLGPVPSRGVRAAALAALCFFMVPLRPLARLADQIQACGRCTERWDEVRHLAGARLQPSAAGMRALVAAVRREAARGDQVLLLPNDPNVEAWFERDRPRLSSLFVFADQYWDRRVDADVAALVARPPRVIVVGPVGYWRGFHHQFQSGRGAERLVDRVASGLLPARYELAATVPIRHLGTADTMEVYVLSAGSRPR